MADESLVTIYRKNASYCRVKATRSRDAGDKAKWLEFADGWEMLANRIAGESSPNVIALDQWAQMPRRGKG